MNTIQLAELYLPVLLHIQRAHKKDYCFPAQLTILAKLKQYRYIEKSRATLNRGLRRLEDEGYLIRRRRIKRHPIHGIEFHSTLYMLPLKALYALRRMGLNVWNEIKDLLNKLRNKYPEFDSKWKKKERAAARFNPKAPEFVKKILNGFGKAFSLVW